MVPPQLVQGLWADCLVECQLNQVLRKGRLARLLKLCHHSKAWGRLSKAPANSHTRISTLKTAQPTAWCSLSVTLTRTATYFTPRVPLITTSSQWTFQKWLAVTKSKMCEVVNTWTKSSWATPSRQSSSLLQTESLKRRSFTSTRSSLWIRSRKWDRLRAQNDLWTRPRHLNWSPIKCQRSHVSLWQPLHEINTRALSNIQCRIWSVMARYLSPTITGHWLTWTLMHRHRKTRVKSV